GTEITFPLLPLLNGTKMKEWFPSMEDRMIIYACQYHRKFTEFNAKTGENRWLGSSDMPWSVEYGRKTLLDNLNLVWNGGRWGRFEGKLIDRIIKAYTDREWRSYEPIEIPWFWAREMSDYEIGRKVWYDFIDISQIYPDFKNTAIEFKANYDPKLASDVITDLGLRFPGGLVPLEDVAKLHIPHQYYPYLYILYAKALGYAGTEILVKDPSNPFYHEAMAGVVPKYLLDSLPAGRYAPGKMIHEFIYGYDTSGRPLKFIAILPTKQDIDF
ncbi:MAG: hypothetical protein QXM71_06310, partial [Thermofilum sp.]